jgi:heterokaryon incompatibility protein (HET)
MSPKSLRCTLNLLSVIISLDICTMSRKKKSSNSRTTILRRKNALEHTLKLSESAKQSNAKKPISNPRRKRNVKTNPREATKKSYDKNQIAESHEAVDVRAATKEGDPTKDVFCTPENVEYYSNIKYNSLDANRREIRLLRVLPDCRNGVIQCELVQNIPLADVDNNFTALSYCAGSATNTKQILVHGVKCNVFANLHHALLECRHIWRKKHPGEDFLLWVDQVCIHQMNLAERSHQVGFMADIYSSAQLTMICLATTESSSYGLNWVDDFHPDFTTSITDRKERRAVIRRLYDTVNSNNIAQNTDIFQGIFHTYISLLRCPWWSRAWVCQEYLLSREAIFLFGYESIGWRELIDALLLLHIPYYYRPSVDAGFYRWRFDMLEKKEFLYQKFEIRQTTRYASLSSLLQSMAEFEATDVRDKIFAFLALAHPGYDIMPDYSPQNDIESVLLETTKKIIFFEDSLEVLGYLWYQSNKQSHSHSWVVDWTLPCKENGGYIRLTQPASEKVIPPRRADASFLVIEPDTDILLVLPSLIRFTRFPKVALQVWGIYIDELLHECNKLPDTVESIYQTAKGYTLVYKYPRTLPWKAFYKVVKSDQLWILYGCQYPVFLRPRGKFFQLIMPGVSDNLKFRALSKVCHVGPIPHDFTGLDIRSLRNVFDRVEKGELQKQRISII